MIINGRRYHTWEDWKHQGYSIAYGERSIYRNKWGTPVFGSHQITRSKFYYPTRYRLVREYY